MRQSNAATSGGRTRPASPMPSGTPVWRSEKMMLIQCGGVTFIIACDEAGVAGRCTFVIDANGAIRARYDKIHLFDVDLPTGERIRESDFFGGGERAVVADLPWCKLGMTICYDVRFPALHRLEEDGWIEGAWGPSENKRRAKYYRLTRAGRRRLGKQTAISWIGFSILALFKRSQCCQRAIKSAYCRSD